MNTNKKKSTKKRRPPVRSRLRWMTLALALGLVCSGLAWAQSNPRRIAEGRKGQVWVSDRGGSIVAFDKESLERLWSLPLPDEGAPFGLDSWNRHVYVGNTETSNVEVYRIKGAGSTNPKLIFKYNLGHVPAGEQGYFSKPISIAIDRRAELIFVLDAGEKLINIFNGQGIWVSSFYPMDSEGQLLSPVSVAADDKRREVLVSDYGDPSGGFRAAEPARILIYDYEGTLRFQIYGDGSTHETTRFTRVQGLTTSDDGRIFATDALASHILVLDRATGAQLDVIGTEGQDPGQLMLPLDVYLDDATGDLFVTNNLGARRVEAFRGAGSLP